MRSLAVQLLTVVIASMLIGGCSNEHNQGGVAMSERHNGATGTNENEASEISNNDNSLRTNEEENGNRIKGEQIANAMLAGKFADVYAQFGDGLQNIVTQKDFEDLGKEFVAGVPQFQQTSSLYLNDYYSYVWRDDESSKGMMAVVDEHDRILGFQVLPLVTYSDTDQQYSQTEYLLPFADEWLVYWGGKDVFLNYHYEYEHMRYAYDFIGAKEGYSYSGDPLSNESYYAFGREVLAPADGVVVAVTDGIEDNIPGEMNEEQHAGNMVVIEHEHGEFSMLAHFKKDSIVVQVGDTVTAGQLLGECGNSGNSSEPHIHFQVFKQKEDGSELAIPVTFADGKEWVRGDMAVGQIAAQ